jgi:two-component system LytT family response regulator
MSSGEHLLFFSGIFAMTQQRPPLRAVIVDDDAMIRKTLLLLLEEHAPDVGVVGEAGSFHEAVRIIYDHKPDLVFMDVQLSDATGFEVLGAFDANDFAIVMMSSFSQYALDAFDYDSKGYLLKPFDIEKLVLAVERSRAKLRLLEEVREYKQKLESLQQSAPTSIIIKSTKGNINAHFTEIVSCSAHYGYTRVARHEQSPLLSVDYMTEWESWLPADMFLRIHRSHIINIHHVAQWEHDGKEGIVRLSNGEILPVSRAHKAELIQRIEASRLKKP